MSTEIDSVFLREMMRAYEEQKPELCDVKLIIGIRGIGPLRSCDLKGVDRLDLPYDWTVHRMILTPDFSRIEHLEAQTLIMINENDRLELYRRLQDQRFDCNVAEIHTGSLESAIKGSLERGMFTLQTETEESKIFMGYRITPIGTLDINANGDLRQREFRFLDVVYNFSNQVKDRLFDEFLEHYKHYRGKAIREGPAIISEMYEVLEPYYLYVPTESLERYFMSQEAQLLRQVSHP